MLWTIFDSLDHVGTRVGHFVHARWLRSHPIGDCPGDASHQSYSGTKNLAALSQL